MRSGRLRHGKGAEASTCLNTHTFEMEIVECPPLPLGHRLSACWTQSCLPLRLQFHQDGRLPVDAVDETAIEPILKLMRADEEGSAAQRSGRLLLQRLSGGREFSDVTLVADGGEEVAAHGAVLALSSDFFKALVYGPMAG